MSKIETPRDAWFVRAFGPEYRALYRHRNDELAERECGFVGDRIGLPGTRLLDLACGAGRHSVRFAAAGARVVGLDLSADLTARASERLPGRIVRGDMRRLPFDTATFDGVTSMFTSFGYFDDVENGRVAREISRVLVRGGRVVFDLMDRETIERDLVPVSEREVDGRRVREERRVHENRVEKRTTVDGIDEPFLESVRLFSPEEIRSVLAPEGLEIREMHGDFDGSEYVSGSSPRMIVTAERRASS